MFDDVPSSPLEGDMNIPGRSKNTTDISQPDFNTLDEPIKDTFVSFPYLFIDLFPNKVQNIILALNFSSVTYEQFALNSITFFIPKKSHHYSKIVSLKIY